MTSKIFKPSDLKFKPGDAVIVEKCRIGVIDRFCGCTQCKEENNIAYYLTDESSYFQENIIFLADAGLRAMKIKL